MKPLAGSNSRLYMAALLTAIVVFSFWTSSRYPDLSEKALMGGDIGVSSLGFDTVIEVRSDASFVKRVFATTINWIDTNKKGMGFGLVLAACIMTLLRLFSRRTLNNVFANTAMGTMIGAPFGVCVNCVAPIARGMHAAGATLETTLATMLSSPTMNVIVLTMAFTVLPFYMAMSKVVLTLLFILLGIPLISKFASSRNLTLACPIDAPIPKYALWKPPDPSDGFADNSLLGATQWLVVTFAQNLWFIVKTTVPLMLGAGFLGALAVTVLPWDVMSSGMPEMTTEKGFLVIVAVTLFGVFMPVPIAFDIVIVAILLAAGMPAAYAMALLFTLGIFSIYSFSIIWTSISRAVAVILASVFVVVGTASGYMAYGLDLWDTERERESVFEALALQTTGENVRLTIPPGVPHGELADRLDAHALTYQPVDAVGPPDITIESTAFMPRDAVADGPRFARLDGEQFGITSRAAYTVLRVLSPHKWGPGIATGDVHNDGWPDVLLALDDTVRGIALYANFKGERFVRQDIPVPGLGDFNVINAALVDLNDDGWLDIFGATNREGNFVIYNERGDFPARNFQMMPSGKEVTAVAVSFGDVDGDGDLDAVLGNWTTGNPTRYAKSQNLFLFQGPDGFEVERPDEILGETLTALLSDFDNDGALDIIIGNDFSPAPDIYYLGDGKGGFRQITAMDGLIPHSTDSTMSVATGDLDNDLVPEIYLAHIARGTGTGFERLTIADSEVCDDLSDSGERKACKAQSAATMLVQNAFKKRNLRNCFKLGENVFIQDCVALNILRTVRFEKHLKEYCDLMPARLATVRAYCDDIAASPLSKADELPPTAIPYVKRRNVLLVKGRDGTFEDHTEDAGLTIGGWSWNAKFADVDNDGLKDLYIANGFHPSERKETNLFYANDGGLTFSDRTAESGLTDYRATAAYSYVDFDNDGDLDIISLPVTGQVRVFVNQGGGETGNAIDISLRDRVGNRFGIGSKVIIRGGGDGGEAQMYEIQSGGGFLSFDPLVAHFGLGADDSVGSIEVQWSTGERSVLHGPFPAGAHYVVTRNRGGAGS